MQTIEFQIQTIIQMIDNQYNNFDKISQFLMNLGEILRTLRFKQGLTLQNMADDLGVSYGTYHKYAKLFGN